MKPWFSALGIVILATALASSPLVSSPSGAQGDDTVTVRALGGNVAFDPTEVTIPAGGTVRWVNDASTFHTITSTDSNEDGKRKPNGEFDEAISSEGQEFEWTYDEPGTFYYFCQPHTNQGMFGTVIVTGEGTGGDQESSPGVGMIWVLLALVGLAFIARGQR